MMVPGQDLEVIPARQESSLKLKASASEADIHVEFISCVCLSAALGNGLCLCPNPVQDYLMLPLHGFLPVEKTGVQASMRMACRQITERYLK